MSLMMEFPHPVSGARGTFRAWAMAAECGDGTWEGWLEFVPTDRTDPDTSLLYTTPIETRRHDRAAMVEWVSGLTRVCAEGALSRATIQHGARGASELMLALELRLEVCLFLKSRTLRQAGNDTVTIFE